MVIKGGARGGAAKLTAHLQRTDTNERAEMLELRGVAAHDLEGALLEMEAVASGARSKRHFYHASINTRADEPLTPEQRALAVDRLEEALGLTGQPRAVVAHEKEGRAHFHVVWSRIDLKDMTAISDSHNYRRHEEVGRELEREFGHARVQGAHVEREGEARPDRTPSHAEMMQAERTGLTPAQAKEQITALWRTTDSGQAFAAAVEDQGWILARGDKRDFVVVDPAGEAHSLVRRVDGAKAKDVRARMADVDPASLPSADQAKHLQAERAAARDQAKAAAELQPAPAPEPPHAPDPAPFRPEPTAAPPEAPLPAQPEPTPKLEFSLSWSSAHVVVTANVGFQPAPVITPEYRTAIEPAPSAESPPAPTLDNSVAGFLERQEKKQLEIATPAAREPEPEINLTPALMVVGKAADAVSKLTDVADRLLDFFVGAPPPRKLTAGEIMNDPAARREHMMQMKADRDRDAAIARIAADVAKDKRISATDLQSLSRTDLEQIKARGDAYLMGLIRRRELEEERKREHGRER